jgi:SpoVK/Ycf46/Vps4 family AAA+-type ATPase
MQSVWEKARSLGRCVIRIDEIDYLLAARGNPDSDALTSDVVGDFMVGFDSAQRDRILIVGEAFTEDAIDPSVVARCSVVILPLPDAHERRKILLLELRKLQCESLIPEFVIPALGSVSGRDLANLAHQILSKAGDCKAITPEVWQEAVAEFVGRRS